MTRVTGRAVAGGMELWRGAHDGGRVGRGMAPGRGGLLQGVGGGGERNVSTASIPWPRRRDGSEQMGRGWRRC